MHVPFRAVPFTQMAIQIRRVPVRWQSRSQTINHFDPSYNIAQSTLMSKLTGTHSEVSEIEFTTLTTVPGTVKVHGAPIQILDLREFMPVKPLADRLDTSSSWNH
jgi:hypothetical protein